MLDSESAMGTSTGSLSEGRDDAFDMAYALCEDVEELFGYGLGCKQVQPLAPMLQVYHGP